jgi:hypothetical protein
VAVQPDPGGEAQLADEDGVQVGLSRKLSSRILA